MERNSLCKSLLESVVFNIFEWLNVFCTSQVSKTKMLRTGFHCAKVSKYAKL